MEITKERDCDNAIINFKIENKIRLPRYRS